MTDNLGNEDIVVQEGSEVEEICDDVAEVADECDCEATSEDASAACDKSQCSEPDTDNALSAVVDGIASMTQKMIGVEEASKKAQDEIHELRRLYHNEYAGRLRKVEAELHRYQEIEKGRAFDGILIEIARLYSDNVAAIEAITGTRLHKQLRYMFLDLLQLLEGNGVSVQESSEEDKRNSKHCQVVDRIPTNDPSLHDTVAKSLSVGFYIDNRSLIKERVHVYVYEKNTENQPDQPKNINADFEEV